jgi:GNAT superfamily N-acetyltransferase
VEPILSIAQPNDMDTLLEFVREYYAFDRHPYDRDAVRAALEGLLHDPGLGRVWLIRDGAIPIGYIVLTLGYSLEYRGRDAFIDELYIRERYRGRGVGRQALAFVERECRALGVHALHLEVERANTGAQQFYRRAGFIDQGRFLLNKWLDPAPGQRSVAAERPDRAGTPERQS